MRELRSFGDDEIKDELSRRAHWRAMLRVMERDGYAAIPISTPAGGHCFWMQNAYMSPDQLEKFVKLLRHINSAFAEPDDSQPEYVEAREALS